LIWTIDGVYQQVLPVNPGRYFTSEHYLPSIMTAGPGKNYPVVELFGLRFRQLIDAA